MKRTATLAALLVLLTLSPPNWAGVTITSIEIAGVSPEIQAQIREVMGIQEGAVYDPKQLEVALSNLRKWGRFTSADITPIHEKSGIWLKLDFHEGSIVSGIDIHGGYPYLSQRLRRMIEVRSGTLYDTASADAQREKLAAFFERKGYAGTEVTLEVPANLKKNTVDLVYRIHKGDRYRIDNIAVTGNHAFPYGYFVSQINPYILYNPGRLRQRLDKIRKDYQEAGYLQSRVRLVSLEKDPVNRTITPALEVTEGKKAVVIFEGNKLVSEGTFKKTLPLFTDGGYSDYDLESSLQVLKKYYRQMGFLEADATFVKEETDPKTLRIIFHIQEGPQTQVKKVTIEGNDRISDRTLKKDLLTKENIPFRKGIYQSRFIEEDFKNLPFFLKRHGALEGAAVSHESTFNTYRDKAHVFFIVHEGDVTHVHEIRFEGNHHMSSGKLIKTLNLRARMALNTELIEKDSRALASYYANRGFPYMSVKPEVIRQGAAASIVYRIDEGTPVTIGEILVVGNERTLRKAVEQALLLKKGDRFSYQKTVDSEASLRKTNAFRSVSVETIGLTEKRPVVHLLVKLEEYRKILLDFGGTFDTDDGLTGNFTLTHVNLFGTAKNGIVKLTGGKDLQRGEAILKDTHFLGFNLEANLSAMAERRRRPGYTSAEGGGSLAFVKEFTPRATLLGRYELTRTFFSNVTDPAGLTEDDHTTSLLSTSFNYDTRDSFADPKKGYIIYAGFDFSSKVFASAFNYVEPNAYVAYYLPLGNRFTLLNYVHFDWIRMIGVDNLTRDRRLFLGGDYSIRGFDEDAVGPTGADGRPAGGLILLSHTAELQARVLKDFKLAAFVDSGSITNSFGGVGGISESSFRHGAGIGLRYVTPIGPIRLDYGFKLDRRPGEPVGRLHFAFGYAF